MIHCAKRFDRSLVSSSHGSENLSQINHVGCIKSVADLDKPESPSSMDLSLECSMTHLLSILWAEILLSLWRAWSAPSLDTARW